MQCKTDWNENDFVNVEDFNRIRANFALLSDDGFSPQIVDASYIITANDIIELRIRYEQIALSAGILSDGPADVLDYETFNPTLFEGDVSVFPRLCWLTFFNQGKKFPVAWELNLYEKLCKRIAEYSPRQKGLIYVGGVTVFSESITIST